MKRARRNGLQLNRPVVLRDGTQWELRKPAGKYVHFSEIELKKLGKNPRSPKTEPDPVATTGVAKAEV